MSNSRNQALKFAIKLIGLRKRSVFEIKRRLRQKEFKEDAINQVVEELKKYKYLDDEKFAESWINDRINFSPRGNILIRKELEEKGIAEEIIDKKINELLGEEKELELAKKAVKKKLKIIPKGLGKEKTYQKIGSYLQSRGYAAHIIGKVLENIFMSS